MKGILKQSKKGQLSLGDAPGVVLIVLFLFMCLGTSAYVLDKYTGAFGSDISNTVNNETLTTVDEVGEYVDEHGACNFDDFAVSIITNATDGFTVAIANYTSSTTGLIQFTGSDTTTNNTNWNISYSYTYAGVACNITQNLTEEVEDNTSIAGMILTISLIGIVLSILIGLFYVFTRRGGKL